MKTGLLFVGGVIVVLLLGGFFLSRSSLSQTQTLRSNPSPSSSPPISSPSPLEQSTKQLVAEAIPGVSKGFQFRAKIPVPWRAEAVMSIDAINIYDPATVGSNNLEESQIFIRQFTANQFLTLQTVTIHEQKELTINGRAAIRYVIEKKIGVADFLNQPSWRNKRHVVTDIRVSDTNPSVFYVIAKRPELDEAVYQAFLTSLKADFKSSQLIEPVPEFEERITKKPFGIYITPANSPVKPERFLGYHTGVDVEYDDRAEEIPVKAISEGEVIRSGTVNGYGGVIVIRHTINDARQLALYGHLDPKSLVAVGKTTTPGEKIGVLGEHQSSETDGERKHLHFAILRKNNVDLRGYVQTKEALNAWQDPRELFD